MGEIIYIASGKGGTGKSALAVNMASHLAMNGKKTVLLDMDMGQGNLDLYLGLHNMVVYNVYDALTGMCKIGQALLKDSRFSHMRFMAAPPHINDGSVTEKEIEKLFDVLRRKYDYIIIDGPSGAGNDVQHISLNADKVILVTTADYAGIRGAEAVDMVLRGLGIVKRYFVINRLQKEHTSEFGYPSADDISRMLRGRVIGIIEEDESVEISLNMGIPAVMAADTAFAENISRITKRVLSK